MINEKIINYLNEASPEDFIEFLNALKPEKAMEILILYSLKLKKENSLLKCEYGNFGHRVSI